MNRLIAVSLLLLVGVANSSARGQGVLVVRELTAPLPRPHWNPRSISHSPHPGIYKIREVDIQARVTDQIARVQVSQTFTNTGSVPIEVQFLFPLPYDGAIDRLTLQIDGKEIPGKILPAKDARSVYESIVRSNRDPALLEWVGMGLFQTSVFPVPAGSERKVTLNYNQLLRVHRGLTDFLFPLSAAKYTSHPVEKLNVRIAIESAVDIRNIYSPTHSIETTRTDARHAVVNWTRQNEIPQSDFRLIYDVGQGLVNTSVLSYRPNGTEEGYFLLLASPEMKAANVASTKKTVILVVDRSGSMSGQKFEQARAAAKSVLNNLHEGDLFNLIAYDSTVESFRPELERLNEQSRQAAMGFIEGLHPGGGTNIHGSLTTALHQLKDPRQPSFVLFLTDGLPTFGVTGEQQICQAVKEANKVHARILTFGVGYDVNSRLLDRISRDGFGQSEYVRPNEDIEAHVSVVYGYISSPVMIGTTVNFQLDGIKPEQGPTVNRVYPKQNVDLFEGQQLVVVGRYKNPGHVQVVISGRIGDQEKTLQTAAMLIEKSSDETYAFIEKLWAMRRIGEIIDEIDLVGKNDELVAELIALSTRHGILTPYTSFLADETVRPLVSSTEGILKTNLMLNKLNHSSGLDGVAQRAAKGSFQNATSPAGPASERIAGSKFSLAEPGSKAVGLALNSFRDIDTDQEVAANTVRQFGNQAIYSRSYSGTEKSILVTPETAEMDLERDRDKIQIVERFTEAYFALVASNTATENQIFSQQRDGEQLLIKLRGQSYLVK